MARWAFRLGVVAALLLLATRFERVVVTGDSMRPTLHAGDRLLVWRARRVEPGWLVVVPDPREPRRPLVKRAARVRDGLVELRGDNPAGSTDSRAFGAVPCDRVGGRAVYRYAPSPRAGRL